MKRIRFLYSTPRSIAYGGQELQAQQLVKSIRLLKPEWDVSFLDYAADEPPADVYHLVGNAEHMWGVARFLDPQSRFVISAIHGIRADGFCQRWIKRVNAKFSLYLGERTTYQNIRSLFARADIVLALTDPSRRFLMSRYDITPNKVHVVPNGVPQDLLGIGAGSSTEILILGSIIDRKSVIEVMRFAKSKEGRAYNFHVIGGPLSNEQDYFKRFLDMAASAQNVHYYGHLNQVSEEFNSVVSKCGVFLQLSKEETQSLAALEAVAAGKACVFLERPYARLEPFLMWPRVKNFQPSQIVLAIQEALRLRQFNNARSDILTWKEVGQRVISFYE